MTATTGFTLFDTALGDCAVSWNELGLTGVWLPDTSADRLRARLLRRHPQWQEDPPQGAVAMAVAAMTRLLGGERLDLLEVRLDESSLTPFDRNVYMAARAIAPGRVVTYGRLAAQLGGMANARAVGQALGRNPFPIVVPCHRIVAANGHLGGFSAPGGTATKRRLLEIEDARLDGVSDLFDKDAVDAAESAPAG